MTLDEAIKHCEEVARENERDIGYYTIQGDKEWLDECEKDCIECAKEHRQLAEWLKELEERREIQNILLQFLVDIDLDICCEELMTDEKEQSICEENCNNQTKGCWIRWAKMKARGGTSWSWKLLDKFGGEE